MSSRLQRSSISPFRSRKAPSATGPKPGVRPTTPSSTVGRPITTSSSSVGRPTTPSSNGRPSTPSSAGRPSTPSSVGRPTTPSSSASSVAAVRGTTISGILPVSGATSSSLYQGPDRAEVHKAKENVTVTVRFRPLSAREISKGDEISWYADGDCTVRNECNPSIAYGFDRVFGPATTTRHVYDVAAQHVVSGAMQGINGTVFAYGVTSSGKTHTMHGEQKSPGIIPLAVKDVFSIIQETPGREFLLRVSYLEIYNEVINDLLDPTGQNLRIREDSQGTYVEGIKEEVVLSPAHALSLIASGEEHRHVGSNNFNLLSSRSHTIFTLTIESSTSNENHEDEDVTLSQLNLIDLAGSESSKAETTGLRRKEGSYINKSLLTLGTVISKLTDDKSTHIPYRDSKLTRLLQSSLSGHGRISLICTVTPASSNSEETHNTLKFAHRSKHVEIKASQNKIMDEKSLIKKYQREISCLKEELLQLKRGMMDRTSASNEDDFVNLKLQLEAGQVKLLSRLEEEEQAKAALMGRIQRLTKLILVSTKNSLSSSVAEKGRHRRRHSFGEDELAYLPDRKREYLNDEDTGSNDSDYSVDSRYAVNGLEERMKFEKMNRKKGVLDWFKLKKPEHHPVVSPNADYDSEGRGSASQILQPMVFLDKNSAQRKSSSRRDDDVVLLVDSLLEKTQAGDLFSATAKGQHHLATGTTIMDEMDLFGEQVKMLAGEIALSVSSLKRLMEQAVNNPEDQNIQEQMQKLRDEINEKKVQMRLLEKRMIESFDDAPHSSNNIEMLQTLAKLTTQLNEKTFEQEIMSADNRILQDQLQMKISDNNELQETVKTLREHLDSVMQLSKVNGDSMDKRTLNKCKCTSEGCSGNSDLLQRSQLLMQVAEIENLKQENLRLTDEKDGLEIHCQKLSEEAAYAKELAAAAAVELRNLAEEVTKLSCANVKLFNDLAAAKEAASGGISNLTMQAQLDETNAEAHCKNIDENFLIGGLQKELLTKCHREESLVSGLSMRDQRERELQKCIDDLKKREQGLENELASMRVLVERLKRSGIVSNENLPENCSELNEFYPKISNFSSSNSHSGIRFMGNSLSADFCEDKTNSFEEVNSAFEYERRRCKELEAIISKLKGDDLYGLDIKALEDLQSFHVEALSKICQEKLTNRISKPQEDGVFN